jgi:alkanesulfonate monooxygenase SsuD/methylene tetrahydromethanopterin reductase-like flavin-dependent oxidoreductase (luciferase family)
MDVGVGLWTMRATAAAPAAPVAMYRNLREDAVLAEELGYHSLWIAEHHFWYDGWCPSPLVAAASALSVTSRLRVGTGIHLVGLREPDELASELAWLQRLGGGRLEHGVGLGYRAAEYDGFGLSRRVRGRRMDAALDRFASLPEPIPRVWVGGMARPAIERAARRGLGLMLPSTLSAPQLTDAIAFARETAAAVGRAPAIGVMKYTWPTDGSEQERRRALGALDEWTREYAGAWFPLKGRPGFHSPELLDAQMRRSADTALVGHPREIAEELERFAAAGVEMCVLHLLGDGRLAGHRDAMRRLAEQALPSASGAAA